MSDLVKEMLNLFAAKGSVSLGLLIGIAGVITAVYSLYIHRRFQRAKLGDLQKMLDLKLDDIVGLGQDVRATILLIDNKSVKPLLVRPKDAAWNASSGLGWEMEALAQLVSQNQLEYAVTTPDPVGGQPTTSPSSKQLRNFIAAPIIDKQGKSIGVIVLDSPKPLEKLEASHAVHDLAQMARALLS